MSFDSAVGLRQLDDTMHPAEIQHRQILLSLDDIYSILVYGDQQETEYAGLVYILYNKLKHYWYDLPESKIYKVQKDIDELELFLQNIVDFD